MKTFLVAVALLVCVTVQGAEATPAKFAGRWGGVAHWSGKRPGPEQQRYALLLSIAPDGQMSGGVYDFGGVLLETFSGQCDAKGRLTVTVQDTTAVLRLSRSAGAGTYYNPQPDGKVQKGRVQLWRESPYVAP